MILKLVTIRDCHGCPSFLLGDAQMLHAEICEPFLDGCEPTGGGFAEIEDGKIVRAFGTSGGLGRFDESAIPEGVVIN